MAPAVALRARLADAVERREPALDEPLDLLGEERPRFAVELAALAVPDEDERDAGSFSIAADTSPVKAPSVSA